MDQDCVDLDTGAVLLDAEILETLFSLIADASGKKADPDKYESFVNEKQESVFTEIFCIRWRQIPPLNNIRKKNRKANSAQSFLPAEKKYGRH